MPETSVIIPTYNNQNYIKNTIESILNNSYKDFELIIINDGSTDDTLHICEELQSNDNRIHIYSQENMGVSAARNRGIELAKGDYISFIDGDDLVSEDYLQTLITAMKEKNLDWVACAHIVKTTDKEDIRRVWPRDIYLEGDECSDVLKRVIFYCMDEDGDMNLPNVVMGMFRRSTIVDNDVRFDQDLRFGEDQVFNYTLSHYITRFAYICRPMYTVSRMKDSSSYSYYKNDYAEKICYLIDALETKRLEWGDERNEQYIKYIFQLVVTSLSITSVYMTGESRRNGYAQIVDMINRYEFCDEFKKYKPEQARAKQEKILRIVISHGRFGLMLKIAELYSQLLKIKYRKSGY